MDIFNRVAQVVGRSGIAASLPDRGDIDEVDCKDQLHPPKEYMIYYVMASVYSMVLPLILMATGVILYRAFAVICVGLSFLFFIHVLRFRKKEFKEEMYKKFHV